MELSCNYSEGNPYPASVEWFRDGLPTGLNGTDIVIGPLLPADNGVGYSCRVRNIFTDLKMVNLTSPTYILVVACKYIPQFIPIKYDFINYFTFKIIAMAKYHFFE
ncbi:hypothetical protein KP79_PYT22076 [Mizuhopecten yessoensis]|uniref:Ig-like domain-containing protein n=1 Tax=Mizuhopecten yessoensis TaxID=6573 RepID=A0A210PTT0_MIZYE|nr:hypothetical protein KP79_PYT22076 [Mizuhopecten yessoensis]